MQETIPPVDLSKLKNILSNSKKIMQKVETNNYSSGHIDPRALNEDGINLLESEAITRPVVTQPVGNYTEEQVKNSRLPDAIKKIMLEKPIPTLSGPNHTFNLEDVSDLQEKPMGLPKTQKTLSSRRTISESMNSDLISITKEELKTMVNDLVNEKLLEFFMKASTQKITEDAVKKTLKTLVSEGKLTVKKKTV